MSLTIISSAGNSTMDGFNIHHSHSHHGSTLRKIAIISAVAYPVLAAPSATVTSDSLISSVTRLAKRADATCSGKSNSAECETPVHTNYLAISLAVVIPLVSALIVLIYLHFRNMKNIKKEEEEDKAIDIDTDDYDPPEAMGYRNNKMPLPMNEEEKSSNTQAGSESPKTHRPPPLTLQDPFASPYQIPQLASSATSLNNYDRYDLSAYPPSMYESPQYPPSIYRRSASPGSVISNPYGDSHQVPYGGKNPSQQALNPSSTSLNSLSHESSDVDQIAAPPRSLARENSALTNKSFSVATGEEKALGNDSTDITKTKSDPLFPQGLVSRNTSSIVIPDDDDDETRHKRIEMSLDMEIHELELKATGAKSVEVGNELAPSASASASAKESQGIYLRSDGQLEPAGKGGSDFDRVKSFYKEYFPSEAVEAEQRAAEIRSKSGHTNSSFSKQHS